MSMASPDATLLAACEAFRQADAVQLAVGDEDWEDQKKQVTDRWYATLEAILALPAPGSLAGVQALAGAGRVALMDELLPSRTSLLTTASREGQLALKALDAAAAAGLQGDAAADDAELAAIGREAAPKIEEAERYDAAYWSGEREAPDNDDSPIHHDRLWELFDRALELRATTMESIRAKLMLVRWQARIEWTDHGVFRVERLNPVDRMAWSLADDLLGSVGGAA